MGIALNDIRHAVLEDGEVSSLAGIFRQALEDPPIPVAARFEAPVPLPSPLFLLERLDPQLAKRLSHNPKSGQPSTDKIDLHIIAAAAYGKNAGIFIEKAIEEIQPDIVVVDI
jgi:hypothetical protein